MTGSDIKVKAERYIDATFNDDIILDAIEDAINWLGNMGYIINTLVIEAESEKYYQLPTDVIRVIKIEKVDEEEYYFNYIIDDNLIRFEKSGKYRIFAERNPAMLENIDDEIKLHPMLANCVKNYCFGYIKLSIDDTSEDGHKLIEQFKENAAKAYETLKRGQRSPTKVWVKRHA